MGMGGRDLGRVGRRTLGLRLEGFDAHLVRKTRGVRLLLTFCHQLRI